MESTFSEGKSPFHRLDPRARLLIAAAWSLTLSLTTDVRVLTLALALASLAVLTARLPIGRLARRVAVVNAFIALLWLTVPWSVAGQALTTIGPITVTREGTVLAAQLTLRCNAIVLALIALLGTMRLGQLATGLHRLGFPDKLSAILVLCVQYLAIIHDDYLRARTAARLRGFTARVGVGTYRTHANLLGLTVLRGSLRAARVHEAMAGRGFEGRWPSLERPAFTRGDVIAIACGIIFTLTVGILEWLASP